MDSVRIEKTIENGLNVIRYFKKDTTQLYIETYKKDNKFHREDGPAYSCYDEYGDISIQTYYIEGKIHNKNGPAKITYISNQICEEYMENNEHVENSIIKVIRDKQTKKTIEKLYKYNDVIINDDEIHSLHERIKDNSKVFNGNLNRKKACIIALFSMDQINQEQFDYYTMEINNRLIIKKLGGK